MSQQTLSGNNRSDLLMQEDHIQRVRGAADELEAGDMEIEPNDDGTFTVKGKYDVDLDAKTCECKDHEYRVDFCKHLMAVKLQVFVGNVEQADTTEPETDTDEPPKPDVLEPVFPDMPNRLKDFEQFVGWAQKLHENKDGTKRWTKVPTDIEGSGFASSTGPETWTDFETAKDHVSTSYNSEVGIGFVVTPDDPIIGIDLDDCRDPETGRFDKAVAEILADVDTYAEVSPSGTGVRILVEGESDFPESCNADLPGEAHIEMYTTGRYLTITGHHIDHTPAEIRNDTDTIEEFDRRTAAEDDDATLEDF